MLSRLVHYLLLFSVICMIMPSDNKGQEVYLCILFLCTYILYDSNHKYIYNTNCAPKIRPFKYTMKKENLYALDIFHKTTLSATCIFRILS